MRRERGEKFTACTSRRGSGTRFSSLPAARPLPELGAAAQSGGCPRVAVFLMKKNEAPANATSLRLAR